MRAETKVVGRIYDSSAYLTGIRVAQAGETPDFWSVYERVEQGDDSGWRFLFDLRTEVEAIEYEARL